MSRYVAVQKQMQTLVPPGCVAVDPIDPEKICVLLVKKRVAYAFWTEKLLEGGSVTCDCTVVADPTLKNGKYDVIEKNDEQFYVCMSPYQYELWKRHCYSLVFRQRFSYPTQTWRSSYQGQELFFTCDVECQSVTENSMLLNIGPCRFKKEDLYGQDQLCDELLKLAEEKEEEEEDEEHCKITYAKKHHCQFDDDSKCTTHVSSNKKQKKK